MPARQVTPLTHSNHPPIMAVLCRPVSQSRQRILLTVRRFVCGVLFVGLLARHLVRAGSTISQVGGLGVPAIML